MAINNYATLTSAIAAWTHRTDLTSGTPPYSDLFIQAAQAQFEKDILDMNFGNGIKYQEASYAPTLITGGVIPYPQDMVAPKLMIVSQGTAGTNPLIFKSPTWIFDNYPIRQATNPPSYIARGTIAPATFTGALASGVLTVSAIASGLVQPGMVITDTTSSLPAALPGSAVIITAQASGTTGSTGTYNAVSCSPLAPSPSVSQETMTGGGDIFMFGPYPDGPYQVSGTYYQVAPLLQDGGTQTNWMSAHAPMTLLAYCMIAAATFLENPGMLQTWAPIAQAGCKGLVDKDKASRWAASTLQVETG